MTVWTDELADQGIDVAEWVPLGPLTTYRVGGAARWFITAVDPEQLSVIGSVTAANPQLSVMVIGNGSNLLVADGGFDGLALQLGAGFEAIDIDVNDQRVRAGASASLPVVARRCAAAGLSGFEWAVGVPGSIGGAVRMNAGGHGAELSESLMSIHVVDLRTGENYEMAAGDLAMTYRHTALTASQVVTSALLQLREGDVAAADAELSEIVRWRREHQPGGANAGSVFRNPPGDSAGRLIDACGGRGMRVGTAEVSTKHANFIQADPEGSADDIFALMEAISALVEGETGIRLHPETHLVGFDAARVAALVGDK